MNELPPRYVQVRDTLVRLFAEKGLAPGDLLPSEAQIAELCNAGRSTVREALKLLEQDGTVTVRRGHGRFLSSVSTLRVERPITTFESATAMLAALGYDARTITLSVSEGRPTQAERSGLELGPSDAVIRLERLRSADDKPLIYSRCTLPRWCIDGPIVHVNWAGSLHQLLASQGYAPTSSMARLRAVRLPTETATRYSLDGVEPWLLISETVITDSGQRILLAEDYHRGDAFSFNVLRRP